MQENQNSNMNGAQNDDIYNNQAKQRYAFVIDSRGVILSPTKAEKAWYKVRHNTAKLVCVNPLTIQLLREQDNTDNSTMHVGIDPGETTGIAIVQQCRTHNKPVFKANINHRKDISKLMTDRASFRRLHRYNKRYRKPRFDNRTKQKGWIPPSIKAFNDEIFRTLNHLDKCVNMHTISVEEAAFDIRVLTDGYKLYSWQYQKSNRLDENLRKAVLLRDKYTCQLCCAQNIKLEAHHITSCRHKGEDTITNLITVCPECHAKVTGKERDYQEGFYSLTKGKHVGLAYASHIMQGKMYLRTILIKLCKTINLTDGGTTANKRIDWSVEKSHANDAIVITGLEPMTVSIYEYNIKPQRRQRKTAMDRSKPIVQGDKVYYIRRTKDKNTNRRKPKILCYVNAILSTGTSAGKYKLCDYKGNRYGPVSIKSLKKVSSYGSLSFT